MNIILGNTMTFVYEMLPQVKNKWQSPTQDITCIMYLILFMFQQKQLE